MKLADVFKRLKPESVRDHSGLDFEALAEEVGVVGAHDAYFSVKGLKSYDIKTWVCTDTVVGLVAYTLDDEPAFVTWKNARKGDTEFRWASEEVYFKIQKMILEGEREAPIPLIEDCDTVDEYFQISYSDQWIVGYKAHIKEGDTYHEVEILELYPDSAVVDRGEGASKCPLSDLYFKINVTEEV